IENRMLAEVEVQKLQQNAEREKVQAQITVTQANARADAVRAEAEANAAATRLAGDAEADAIRAKGAALRDNPSLINLTAAEKWNGALPSTMVPGSALPFIGVK
ncbi:MAG: Band 7 protein, partial [Rhizobium sp.]|nr:Band 7 protein [Rhizobium sp.]